MYSQFENFIDLLELLSRVAYENGLPSLGQKLRKARVAAIEGHYETLKHKPGHANPIAAGRLNFELPGIRAEYSRHKSILSRDARDCFERLLDIYPREVDRIYWNRKDVRPAKRHNPKPDPETDVRGYRWGLPEPKPGDVLGVSHITFCHYGVYIGGGLVMHYAEQKNEGNLMNGTVHRAPLGNFSEGSRNVFVLDFPISPGMPIVRDLYGNVIKRMGGDTPLAALMRQSNYHLFTPAETVARAKSREGEHAYWLPFNNCEHFAVWCKTGVKESHQVNAFFSSIYQYIATNPMYPI